MRHFLPPLVSIKREFLSKFSKIRQILHAMSGAQKNPRRARCLTGIYANNLKLRYGETGIRTLDTLRYISFQD